MESAAPTRLTIELDSAEEPIQGRIGEEGEASREFCGWLGLASALGDAVRPTNRDQVHRSIEREGSQPR